MTNRSLVSPMLWALVALLVTPAAMAQTPAAQPKPCATEQHRQFDFWVGDWQVTLADGTVAGTNRIEKILGGCVVKENWTGAQGLRGESFNIYTAGQGWHQTWVDGGGRLLRLDGAFEDGRMVLSGETKGPDGKTRKHEISWELLKDGRVKQHWRMSPDQGQSWNDAFIGFYARQ